MELKYLQYIPYMFNLVSTEQSTCRVPETSFLSPEHDVGVRYLAVTNHHRRKTQ